MNKKGKNKKGKLPNPVPVQEEKSCEKVEDSGKSDKIENVGVTTGDKKEVVGLITDIIPNLEEKVEGIKEKRVPEIVSEVITPTVDVKDEETPKKPKRNRGKKKKGKDDDFDDDVEEKPKETDIQMSSEETKVDVPEVESKIDDMPQITPTARKKKNKKKNADQKAEEIISPDQELASILVATEVKEEIKQPVSEHKEEFMKTDITDLEVKPSKKKNKKKKRTDSEKSEKEEFSCTSAFQKLLDDKNETEIKIEEKVDEPIIALESVKADVETEQEKTEQTLPVKPVIEKAATPVKEMEETKEISVPESKSKKKNKKDKKQTPKLEETPKLDEAKSDQTTSLINFNKSAQNVVTEPVKEPLQDVLISSQDDKVQEIAITESPEPLIADSSPKTKAKIAKPVEKKRKGKHESSESLPHDTFLPDFAKVEDDPFKVKLKIIETEPVVVDKPSDDEPQTAQLEISSDITLMAPDEDDKLIAQEFELLAEKAMGKKRKKGSKMPKTLDIGILEPKTDSDAKQTDIKETPKEQLAVITEILTPQTDQQEFIIKSEKSDMPTAVDTIKKITEETPKAIAPEFPGKVLLTPENIGKEVEFTKTESTESTEDKQNVESKSSKKRKKSPKPPRKSEEIAKTEERAITPKPESASQETSKSEDITQESLAEKVDASNITRMYDIEISSIRVSESEGSTSDPVPDITYPRASSQQMCDDNNNTVIREMFPPAEPILNIPPIQERAQTPKKLEEKKSPPKEEKTDIKSKMMEVNQDMEELRLSIERSLAELTSMEKSEDTIEKEFEETRNKAKNVSSLLFGTDESATKQKSSIRGKSRSKSPLVEAAVSIPSSEEIKTPTVVEDIKKQKPEDKPKHEDKKSKKDKHKKIPPEEKKIELPFVETKVEEPSVIIDNKTIVMPPKEEGRPKTPIQLPSIETPLTEVQKVIESFLPPIVLPPEDEEKTETLDIEKKDTEKPKEQIGEISADVPPVCPARKDNKGKNKKKKGKQDTQMTATTQSAATTASTQSQHSQETKKEEKTESKTESKGKSQSTEKGKQQASNFDSETQDETLDYEPIENFEDALTSSIDDVNKSFEMIVKETQEQNNPKINIIAPDEEKKTPVSPPKNLLGHPDIPVRSNRRDFKKEKDKLPNEITARVKIKDSVEVEKKQTKNTQTNNTMKEFSKDYKIDDNDDFVYKYSFRKVFLQSSCHVCKKSLSGSRVPCSYCNLLFYCSNKHKDEDWNQHQALCFAVSTIVHLKDQKHIYGDAKNLTGHDYRLIRMQMIVSCEKVLKRRLVPWEQEALLYPRVCAHVPCREWRQSKLSDCQGCGQISFCTDNADHFPKSHSRWCKSYSLYEKLVSYQQTKGRLEPKMPTKVLVEPRPIPEKINEVLASMYEEKIDITDIQYAALTQLATAPLTAAYCHQLCRSKAGPLTNGVNKKSSFTIHVVGAELQFEADALNKWEVFFLHLRPDLQELRVVLINQNLNPSNLPLELLGKIKLCENCRQNKRRVVFSFQDKRTYADYKSSEDFVVPDIVCAFNPSIQRSSVYNGKDPWPSTIDAILKLKVPFIVTGYTITELQKDCIRIKECSETGFNFIAEPKYNNFASVRPDRNFISDDEMPLLFKNYCFAIINSA